MSNQGPLGKGLSALLPTSKTVTGRAEDGSQGPYMVCPVNAIRPNPYQPRKRIGGNDLSELAESIRKRGVLQPLMVRSVGENAYELIAGERRWRAAQLAGLEKVPVLLRDASAVDRLELALIENIQRQDLNPLEEAESYYRLVKEFSLTQDEIAKRVGKQRSTVANMLRIVQLPDFAKQDVADGVLSTGHARALLSLEDHGLMRIVRDEIVAGQLNVRQAENLARKYKKKTVPARRKKTEPALPESYCKTVTTNLSSLLGAKSRVVQKGKRGRVEIEYASPEDLERLLGLIIRQG